MARKDRVGEYHETFARQIIEQIKEGTAPFQKPWKPGERSLPENLLTGRRYTGGNSLSLAVAGIGKGYTDNRWATYRQIEEAGGHVRRGEKGTQILFWSTKKTVPAKDDQGNPKLTDSGERIYTRLDRPRPFAKVYTVFNAEQTRGLPDRPPATPPPEWEAHSQADAIIEASGVDVQHQAGDRAYYNVRTDQVVLPERGQFPSAAKYYQTALHELGHATGHPDRLNRPTLGKRFGSQDYAREELRAEISAMMTGEKIGLGHDPRHGADYVAGWVKALEDDPREIYRAAADAEKMSRYLIEPAREHVQERAAQTRQEMEVHAEQRLEAPSPDRDFNRAVEHAAASGLKMFEADDHVHPPEQQELVRQLRSIRSAAVQNSYDRQADFRPIVAALQNYATERLSDQEERNGILALAEDFRSPDTLAYHHTPGDPYRRTMMTNASAIDREQAWREQDARHDLNHRIQAAATAGLTAVRDSPERQPGDRRVLLSTLHDIDNQAATRDFDHNSKFSATAQRILDYAEHQDPGPHRDALTSAGDAFRQLPTPLRAVNHRIADASQDALHHLGQTDEPRTADFAELTRRLTRINTAALNNQHRPEDTFHATAGLLHTYNDAHDRSPELSQAADRLLEAQASLDRIGATRGIQRAGDVVLADGQALGRLQQHTDPTTKSTSWSIAYDSPEAVRRAYGATDPGDAYGDTPDDVVRWLREVRDPEFRQHAADRAAAQDAPTGFHPSITLEDRVDAHLERQGMREAERDAFLKYLRNSQPNALRDYADRNGITPPEQIRAREREASPSR